MKTYEEYLNIIKERERKEEEERMKPYREMHKKHGSNTLCGCLWVSATSSKMTFDYSVEIMGMMMQDFIKELKEMKNETT